MIDWSVGPDQDLFFVWSVGRDPDLFFRTRFGSVGRSRSRFILWSIYQSERTGCDSLLEIARAVVNKTYLVRDSDRDRSLEIETRSSCDGLVGRKVKSIRVRKYRVRLRQDSFFDQSFLVGKRSGLVFWSIGKMCGTAMRQCGNAVVRSPSGTGLVLCWVGIYSSWVLYMSKGLMKRSTRCLGSCLCWSRTWSSVCAYIQIGLFWSVYRVNAYLKIGLWNLVPVV